VVQINRKTPGFFDFLSSVHEKYQENDVKRMNLRHGFIIESNLDSIAGSDVLDLASHDGRWCYAFAAAGAKSVVGVEGRPELVSSFVQYPASAAKKRIDLRCGDIFDFLENMVREERSFDVVGVLGIFYHIMDHYRLLRLIARLKPKLVIIDSDFMMKPWPFISLVLEDPRKDVNAIAGNELGKVPIGIPSTSALELMASCLNYTVEWSDWETLAPGDRAPVSDYFRSDGRRRATCVLRPMG
jgi:Methyltransferase domain